MRQKSILLSCCGILLAFSIGIGGWLCLKDKRMPKKPALTEAVGKEAVQGAVLKKNSPTNGALAQLSSTNAGRGLFSMGARTNGAPQTAEQAMVVKMHDFLDAGDEVSALQLARTLKAADDATVRAGVVEVLGWIGVKALPTLSELMADPDPDVAKAAIEQWKRAVDEIADEAMKADMLVAGMSVITDQEELESCVMEFDQLPNALSVRGMVRLIQSGNPRASEVAREHYEFATGEAYRSPEAAEKWIKENQEQ